jgi:bifunctional pyridoxal-dependent enzyme with beta-cystathionase and maltose regulon repressor activities
LIPSIYDAGSPGIISKEIKITIEAITNVKKRVIILLTKYSNIYKVLKNIGMHHASRYIKLILPIY